jgi:hypothetical protein
VQAIYTFYRVIIFYITSIYKVSKVEEEGMLILGKCFLKLFTALLFARVRRIFIPSPSSLRFQRVMLMWRDLLAHRGGYKGTGCRMLAVVSLIIEV